MKTRTIILLTITAVVLISVVVRETGLLELDVYKSNNQLSAADNWTAINTAEPKNRDRIKVKRDDLSILILAGGDTLYKKINKLKPITVRIDKLESGPMWFPLYKSTKYTTRANTSLSENGYDSSSHHGIVRHLEGRLDISGELTIVGMCSHRTAEKILYKSIVERIAEKVTDKFAGLPEDFFNGTMKNTLAYKKQ